MKRMLLPLLALVALALPARAITDEELRDIVPNGFSRASVITVNGYAGSAPLANFPVLVKIEAGAPTGFQYSDLMFPSTGDDLGFVDMEGNGLPFEIDEWNPSGTSVLWVTLPSVANGTNFVMVYRSSHTGKSLNANNPFADYVGVWHLGETASGSTTIKDSTDNALHGTSPANSSPRAEGAIGGSRRINTNDNLNGSAQCIQVPLGAANSAGRAAVDGLVPEFTASFWWRHPANFKTRWNQLIGRKLGPDDPTWHLVFDLNNTSRNQLRVYTAGTDGNSHYKTPKSPQTTCEVWYKVDLIYYVEAATGKGKFRIYYDGDDASKKEDYAYNNAPAANSTGDFYIGGSGGSRPYLGWMDEVRIRKFIPTADWMKAEYDQATSASFLSKAEVVEFIELPKPVVAATRGDFGAAFAQFSGSVSQLGGAATSCDVYAKVWPVGGAEPATGSLLASGFDAGDAFTNATVTGLSPQTEYNWAIYAVNNLTPTAYESDPVTGTFRTAGVGGAGTGGVVTRVVDDYVHVFEIDLGGTATYEFTPPAGVTAAQALLVAGGGPGGFHAGGGGGAGGLLHDLSLPIQGGTTYTVTIGAGGVPSSVLTDYGTNGGDSLITSEGGAVTNAIAYGGGAGGNGPVNGQTATIAGRAGGSGGGSTRFDAAVGAGSIGQGSAGGVGLYGGLADSKQESGGGGGAGGTGSAGSRGSTQFPGAGGAGIQLEITGTPIWYAGGGSGGGEAFFKDGNRGYPTSGGNGGGGRGGMQSDIAGDEIATAGTDGLGGGGGGGSTIQGYERGAPGGSGVVVVRYPATGTGAGATEPTVSLTGLEYDSQHNVATLSYRVAWAGAGYQRADVSAVWGFSEDALANEVPLGADVIGRGTGTIAGLPSVSRTVYVKLKATNAGNASGLSTETRTIALYNPRAPEAAIASTAAAVDGGTVSVNVTSLGQGASSAAVSLQACANRAFASDVVTNANPAAITSAGSVDVVLNGLADSSTWWVRAVVSNDLEQVYETDPVSITTLTPGDPNGSGTITETGFDMVSASTRATVIGYLSTSVTRWIEASESEDFATLVGTPVPVTTTRINADAPTTLTGLSPNTAYHLRLVLSNNWNRIGYVRLEDFTTRAEPFAASGPAWTGGNSTLDFSLDVAAVYAGAECTAVLTYNGNEIGTQMFTAAGTVSWPGVPAAADGAIAQIVVTATLPNDGGTFTKTYSAPVASGSSGSIVSDIAQHCSAVNALWMRPGDSVALPTLFGDASYQVLNERFAAIEGSTLTALEPGIVGVRCVNATHVTNVMGVVILPDAIGSGNVYVYKETGRNGNVVCDWSRPQCWDKVENGARAASNTGCPTNADDIAVLPFYNFTGDQYIRHCTDIAVAGVYAGQIRPDTSVNCHMERYKYTDLSNKTEETAPHTVTFRRSDGNPVEIKVCPNSEGGNYTRFVLGGYDIDVVWASDAIIDGCSSETDVNGPRGRFYVKTGGSTNTLQNVTLTFQGYPGYRIDGNGCTDTLKGVWKGTGEIVKKGQGGIAFDGDFSGFSGTITDLTAPKLGDLKGEAAGVLMRATGASNVMARVYGYTGWDVNGIPTTEITAGQGRGRLGTGGADVTPDRGAQAPAKGVYLHGGAYRANAIPNKTWGVGVKDDKVVDMLSIGTGLSHLAVVASSGNGSGYPINSFTAKRLEQTDRGTLVVFSTSCNAAPSTSVTNDMIVVEDWEDHVVGAAGDNQTTDVYPIIPWIVVNAGKNSNNGSNWDKMNFATFDANGRIVRPIFVNSEIDGVASEDSNAYVWGKDLDRNSGTTPDIRVQSLYLDNSSKNKFLGEGRTLTIASGGLILHDQSAIGLPGRDDNGALVLGDAQKPAYVFAKGYGTSTNRIWATVTAAGGFVKSLPGNLELGGDQTGIADEIVVNGGTLALGSADYGITLTNGLPIRVCAGAKLILPSRDAIAANPLKIDGSGGAFGKAELPANQRCASLAVRDVAESDEWTTLPEGTYGSSASGAEFVRDDLFSGPGVLTAGSSKKDACTLLLIW